MNIVILLGRLTKDPDFRVVGETEICKFTLAVDRHKKDEADFIQIVTFGKLAANCANYLSKGKMVCVEGRIQVRSYDQDGQRKWSTEVIASAAKFLSPKDSTDSTQADPYQEVGLDENCPF